MPLPAWHSKDTSAAPQGKGPRQLGCRPASWAPPCGPGWPPGTPLASTGLLGSGSVSSALLTDSNRLADQWRTPGAPGRAAWGSPCGAHPRGGPSGPLQTMQPGCTGQGSWAREGRRGSFREAAERQALGVPSRKRSWVGDPTQPAGLLPEAKRPETAGTVAGMTAGTEWAPAQRVGLGMGMGTSLGMSMGMGMSMGARGGAAGVPPGARPRWPTARGHQGGQRTVSPGARRAHRGCLPLGWERQWQQLLQRAVREDASGVPPGGQGC